MTVLDRTRLIGWLFLFIRGVCFANGGFSRLSSALSCSRYFFNNIIKDYKIASFGAINL